MFCILSVCDFKLSYPACNAHVPYRHSLPARYIVFTKLSHSDITFEIKLLTEISVLILYGNFVQINSHCKKKRAKYVKSVCRSSSNRMFSKCDCSEI
jgi:hypothetical protein